ncbi:NADPH dehydrogenase NamA [Chryseobacterium sp. BIGb0232]|uniref:NADPH dehydrogenase NamA n=1 Tax=Chryseobacterium sp. BIGb0232 TaxID=2940598 RepID=UPI000F48FDDD|nr:NADPH dehydrogenase NamA [Chryseobacterium sp. BIGb0232]MCS4302676.1 NADPH2 dehydrogenase [Chryseobacterium sp. BIGb0232]ROS17330.1 NADPH2 dehydrogenase [Chryseobacterium nakagawai]
MSNTMLLSPFQIGDLKLKNRVVMSPMCMHAADEDGEVTDWLTTHYTARALGQVGLIFLESLAINKKGMIGPNDIGIWADKHVAGLKKLIDKIHSYGAKVGAQISHGGRLSYVPKEGDYERLAPSAIPLSEDFPIPRALTIPEIKELVAEFGQAARRAKEAGFDILEIHTAHGYMLNEFLSPLSNTRTDEYGGSQENRYRILSEIIREVKNYWDQTLFVRISSNDYKEGGNIPEDFINYAKWMKADGIDLIDCSSGGIAAVKVNSYPNYQVGAAELIKKEVDILTGAVGLVETGKQAEEILRNNRADLVFVGRAMLRDPFWVRSAAVDLKEEIDIPVEYTRYGSNWFVN